MEIEYKLKELLKSDSDDIRRQAAILADNHFPLDSVWTISLKQVMK